jgi:hypothetical protein
MTNVGATIYRFGVPDETPYTCILPEVPRHGAFIEIGGDVWQIRSVIFDSKWRARIKIIVSTEGQPFEQFLSGGSFSS